MLAGGPAFDFELRVPHLSRCVTGGVFDFDSFIRNCRVPASSRFFEGAEGLVFLLLIFNSIESVDSDQPLIE